MSGVHQPTSWEEYYEAAKAKDRSRYLVDEEAQDVSRMTGIPWSYEKVHSKGIRRPFMDLASLSIVERFRVALAIICGYTLLSSHTKDA